MYLSLISNILPISVILFVFKKLPVALKILAMYISVSGIMDLTTFILFQNSINNMVVYHLHTFVELLSLSGVYFYMFRSRVMIRRFIVFASVGFLIISGFSLIKWEGLTEFNTIQRMTEYIILMFYFVMFFSSAINSKRAPFLELHPYFVLTMGLFIYFSGTLLIFLNANHFIELGIVDFWMIHGLLNVFLNITYTVVLWNGSKIARYL